MQPLWQALDDGGAEIVLSGHSHDYERFAPLDPSGALAPDDDGIRQFVGAPAARSSQAASTP